MGASLAAAAVLLLTSQTMETAADGGFTTQSEPILRARRRVLEVHAPELADQYFVVTDSQALETRAFFFIQQANAESGRLEGATVRYPAAVNGEDVVVSQGVDRTVHLHFGGGTVKLRWLWGGEASAGPDGLEFRLRNRLVYRVRALVPLEWNGAEIVATGDTRPFQVSIEVALVSRLTGDRLPLATSWGAAMAWDGDGQRLVRVGGTAGPGEEPSTWAWDEANGWVDLKISGPPTRVRGAMVWDQSRHRMLLFGGSGSSMLLDDTWELTPAGWTQRFPTHHPSARWAHAMAYDERRQRPVLYGGLQGDGFGIEYDDTWEWDGNDWVLMNPVTSPGPRDAHGMAYDPTLGEVVLFGGWNALSGLNDTWSWDGTRWRELPTPVRPPPRSSTALAWDPVGRRLVLAGGWDVRANVYLDDTWAFDGVSWTPLPPAPARWMRLAFASHPTLGVIAFGGCNHHTTFNWTLTLEAAGWRSVDDFPAGGPLVHRAGQLRHLTNDGAWAWRPSRWYRAELLPFTGATHAADLTRGPLALAQADGGLETWRADADGGPWTLVDGPSGGRASGLAVDLALDRAWARKDDGTLSEWRDTGWGAVPLPPTTRALGGALLGRVLLVEDDVIAFQPDSGFEPFLPAPFPDAGHYTLQFDQRRDVIIASGGEKPGLFAEWVDSRWELVSTRDERFDWRAGEGGTWVGWIGDGGFARYEPARFNGAVCADSRQCASGVCADGRCCVRACGTSASDCEACSVAAGGQEDGLCTPIRSGVRQVCGGDGACLLALCAPGDPVCPAPADVCAHDSGPVAGDAGHLPVLDAGPLPDDEAPASCQCGAVDGGLTLFAGLVLLASTRRRRTPRG